jgi:hypothetical protein
MSGCEKYLEQIYELTENGLDGDSAGALAAHISSCDACRRVYCAFMEIKDGIKAAELEPPENLTESVMTAIREKSRAAAKNKRPRFIRYAAIAACLVLAVYAGVMLRYSGLLGGYSSSDPYKNDESAEASMAGGVTAPEDGSDPGLYAGLEPGNDFGYSVSAGSDEKAQYQIQDPDAEQNSITAEVRLFSAQDAELFSNIIPAEPFPVLSSISQEILDDFFGLLDFSETKDTVPENADPAYIMKLTYADDGGFDLKIWIIDGAIYTRDPEERYYKSACDLTDFLSFILAVG